MELTTLGQLPVGAAFIRHDEYGDYKSIWIKVSDHGYTREDTSFCGCGRLSSGYSSPIFAAIEVQEVDLGQYLSPIAFALASSSEWRERMR